MCNRKEHASLVRCCCVLCGEWEAGKAGKVPSWFPLVVCLCVFMLPSCRLLCLSLPLACCLTAPWRLKHDARKKHGRAFSSP